MSAARSFHLTPADAIRDALALLDDYAGYGDDDEYGQVIALEQVTASLHEALALLGERP